jgi:mono/diheme cytochrome c family protein
MDQNHPYFSKIPAIKSIILLVFSLLILTACSFSLAEDITPPPGAEVPFEEPTQPPLSGPLYPMVPPDPSAGSAIYAEKCAPCHGVAGLGDGSMAGNLPVPAPALGADAVARQASPAAWYVVVTQGNLERRMPPFNSLTDRQRWDVVAYLYSLSNPQGRILQGEELYLENCASCHGEKGNGKGTQATSLSTPPTNFTDQELMAELSGEQLFQAISEGISPDMPAYAEQFSPKELWALSAYLRSLSFASQIAVSDISETPTPAVTQTSEILVASPTVVIEAGLGTIEGQVIGFSGGDIPSDLSVTLHGFDQMQQTYSANTPVEADGEFIFEDVPMPERRAFLASMDYDGVAYSSEISVVDSETTRMVLIIPYYETTSETTQLSVDRLHLLFEYLEPDTLRVVEMYIISNSGDQVVVASEEGQPVLSYSLPEGATNLQFQDGIVGERYILQANGFGDYAVIRPGAGQHQVIYSYDLSYKNKLNFSQPIDLPVDAAVILLPEDGIRITGEQLNDMGTRDVQGGAYHMYSKELIKAGSNFEIEISGRPQTSGAGLVLGSNRNLIIGVLAFGVALILAGGWLYIRTRNGETADETSDLEEETLASQEGEDVDTLLDTILTLDDQYQAGELPKEAYLKRRADLKTKIREILQEEE